MFWNVGGEDFHPGFQYEMVSILIFEGLFCWVYFLMRCPPHTASWSWSQGSSGEKYEDTLDRTKLTHLPTPRDDSVSNKINPPHWWALGRFTGIGWCPRDPTPDEDGSFLCLTTRQSLNKFLISFSELTFVRLRSVVWCRLFLFSVQCEESWHSTIWWLIADIKKLGFCVAVNHWKCLNILVIYAEFLNV